MWISSRRCMLHYYYDFLVQCTTEKSGSLLWEPDALVYGKIHGAVFYIGGYFCEQIFFVVIRPQSSLYR